MASSKIDVSELGKLLERVRSVTPDELEDVLHKFQALSKRNLECEFYLIRCREDRIREDDFVRFLLDTIVRCNLSYAKTHPNTLGITPQQVIDYFLKNMCFLVDEAKGLLMTKQNRTGEFGELFLFAVLESKGIVQLLNKMNLKTSSEMPVHGLDAIHISVDKKSIILHYGYSKVYKTFSKALNEATVEIDKFLQTNAREEREFSLVSSHIDSEKFAGFSEKIAKLLSPYERNKENLRTKHSVFIGYEWGRLRNAAHPKSKTMDNYLINTYKKKHSAMTKSIENKLQKLSKQTNPACFVCVLPFPDLERVRSKFLDKIRERREVT